MDKYAQRAIAGNPGAGLRRDTCGALRHAREIKPCIDPLFLALVILLCIRKILTN
jgi:hypothetical protein